MLCIRIICTHISIDLPGIFKKKLKTTKLGIMWRCGRREEYDDNKKRITKIVLLLDNSEKEMRNLNLQLEIYLTERLPLWNEFTSWQCNSENCEIN